MMIDYPKILSLKFFGSEWSMEDETYESLTWYSESEKPTKEQLDSLWQIVQAEELAEQQSKENLISSAIEKLSILGLTVDEAKAVIGL